MFKEIWNDEDSINRICDILEIGIAVIFITILFSL